jgi:hypothetical protein
VRPFPLLLIGLIACAESLPPSDGSLSSPRDPAPLHGRWEGELIAGNPIRRALGFGQLVPVTVTITPLPTPRDSTAKSCRGCASGSFAAHAHGVLRPPYQQYDHVEAWLLADDRTLLRLGGCCDLGELELHGQVDGDRIRGRWFQVFLGDGPNGTFVLRRASQGEAAKAPHN